MTDDTKPQDDPAVAAELQGVPEDLIETGSSALDLGGELGKLREDLDAAKQDVLYARAETQNVRRRMEKDVTDARAYAATGFARDILSVSDNLTRALEAIPADLREDDRMKGLVAGIEATGRELDKVFAAHGITRIAAVGLPLDPNQHQAMIEAALCRSRAGDDRAGIAGRLHDPRAPAAAGDGGGGEATGLTAAAQLDS